MVKGFVMMWSILLYSFNEQLFCCEWSCLDVAYFIVKNNFVGSGVEYLDGWLLSCFCKVKS